MKKPKKKYQVYTSYYFINGDYPWESHQDKWSYEGETWAVSEKQAINNIRHRVYGDNHSQYKPWDIGTYGDYSTSLDWMAVESDKPLYPEELEELSIAWRGL